MASLVEYDREFLSKSWIWLNDPEMKALTLTPDFSKEEQLTFYDNLQGRKDYWIRGVIENGIPIGAMGLKNITAQKAEYWGYIGDKSYWGKGIGVFMLNAAINQAKILKLAQLHLIVSNENLRAKALYLNNGFQLLETGRTEKYFLIL